MKTFQKMKATHAKNRFGELLDNAQAGPVMIEKNGRDVAVLLSKAEYDRLLMGGGDMPQEIEPAVVSHVDEVAPETKQTPLPKPLKKKVAKAQAVDEVVDTNQQKEVGVEIEETPPVVKEQKLDESEIDVHALVHTSLERHNKQWAGLYHALAGEQ
ncbi:MAG: type II toxin-antitoxin system Phd/YefM family antitoxin [Rhizobiaceae bacterium]